MPSNKNGFYRRALVAALGSFITATSQAEILALEEVVVTAQKRAESLQDVPISVSAMTGDKLSEAGISRIADLQAYVPNLSMTEAALGSNVYIRGMGSQVNQGFEQSVGTYVDGIYYGRARQLRAPFFDLERVEVLRGPQGILFGKNSIAGALNLTTAKPTDEFEGEIAALYEPKHGEKEVSLVLSGPLSNNLKGRLALRQREMDGFVDNVARDEDQQQTDEQVIRGTLVWDVSNDLDITLKAESGTFDSDGRNLISLGEALPGRISVVNEFQKREADDKEFSDNDYENYTLTVNYSLGEHTLTAVSGYSTYEFEESVDTDFGRLSLVQTPSEEDFEQFSQELRLTSPVGETFEYIVGAFYQTNDVSFAEPVPVTLPGVQVVLDRQYGTESDTWAVFGQGTWNFNESLRTTLGLRYTEEDKEGFRRLATRNLDGSLFGGLDPLGADVPPLGLFPHDLAGKRDEESLTPMVNVQWDATPDVMLYASLSTGFKAGGFDARSNRRTLADGSPALEFEEEEALAVELGSKMTLLDGAAELNIALFRTEYEDLQVSVFDGILGFDVANAAEAITQGVELDGRWRVSEGLTLTGALAYTDFEFQNYDDGACYAGQTPDRVEGGVPFCDWEGNTNQFTPQWSASVSADYVVAIGDNLEFRSVLDLSYSDDYYAAPDLDPNAVQDAYTKVNLRLSIGSSDGAWDLALVGKNLTDEEIVTFANDVPLSGATPSYFAFVERPRHVAIQGRYRF